MSLLLGLVGCGGMGRRHIRGLQRLQAVGRQRCQLLGVADPVAGSAEQAANLAAELLGRRPAVFADLQSMQQALHLDAVDIATSPEYHAPVGIAALQAGLHVLVEKPITLTLAEGARLVAAARASGRRLAVAENYRRDPVNRLARALLDAGVIGRPFLAVQSSSGAGNGVIITPWRHRKQSGGIIVDMGIHYADLLEYYLGPVQSLAGLGSVVHAQRVAADGVRHPADAEDLCLGVLRFASGALGQWLLSMAGTGADHFTRTIYGTAGALSIPADRTGQSIVLSPGPNGQALSGEALLALVPDFALDATTAALFGGERSVVYQREWAEVDANLLAVELADFADAVAGGHPPEVAGEDGLRSLAVAYGFLEADRLGRFVSVDELLAGGHLPYQRELEATP